MGINPADYIVDINIDEGYQSARLGYPLRKDENSDHKKGWETFHKQREEECKALNIPYRAPHRV